MRDVSTILRGGGFLPVATLVIMWMTCVATMTAVDAFVSSPPSHPYHLSSYLTRRTGTMKKSTRTSLPPALFLTTSNLSFQHSSLATRPSSSFLYASLTDPGNEEQESLVSRRNIETFISSTLGAIAILACIVLFHELGHYLTAKSLGVAVDEFSIGWGPKLASFTSSSAMSGVGVVGEQFSLRLLPFGGYVSLNGHSLATLPWLNRIEVLLAGIFFNLILSFLIYTRQIMAAASGLTVPVFDSGILVSGLAEDSPARGSLEEGDVIAAVNGRILLPKPSSSAVQVDQIIDKLIQEVQATPDGEHIIFTVLDAMHKRGVRNVEVTPTRRGSVGGDATTPPSLGVFLLPHLVGFDERKTDNSIDAMAYSASHVLQLTQDTATGIMIVFGNWLKSTMTMKKNLAPPPPSKQQSNASTTPSSTSSSSSSSAGYRVRGPLGVVKKASKVVQTNDWDAILDYVATLSINLAVINCIPIPPSDGFQILLTTFNEAASKL